MVEWRLSRIRALMRSRLLDSTAGAVGTLQSETTTNSEETAAGIANAKSMARNASSMAQSAAGAAQTAQAGADTAQAMADAAGSLAASAKQLADGARTVADQAKTLAAKKCEKIFLGNAEVEVGGIIEGAGIKPFIRDMPGVLVGDTLLVVSPVMPDNYLMAVPVVIAAGKVKYLFSTPTLNIATKYKFVIPTYVIR